MISQIYFLDYFNSLIDGNKKNCKTIVAELLNKNTDLKEIYTDIFQKSLYRIGKLWEEDQLSVAKEHECTKIVESLMNYCFERVHDYSTNGHNALVSCIDKEYHEVGAKMAYHIFELNGWNTSFLGASTPTKEIVKYIKEKKPEIVGLSFNFYLNLMRLREVIDHIKKFFPELKIVLGGNGVSSIDDKFFEQFPDIKKFDSIKALDEYLKSQSLNKN